MQKKVISKSLFSFLQQELEFFAAHDVITADQKDTIVGHYETKSLNFIKVLLTVGSLLIGLGILSFIASNWDLMSKSAKFITIIALYIAANFASCRIRAVFPKTSVSLMYLGTLIFGAGIFLVGQIFNFGQDFTISFLLWGAGIIPAAMVFRSKAIFIFSHLLFFVYLNGSFALGNRPYIILLVLAALYLINIYFENSKACTFLCNLLAVNSIIVFLHSAETDPFYITASLLMLGLAMYLIPVKLNRDIFKFQGLLMMGITGIVLSYRDIWRDLPFIATGRTASIAFSIVIVLFFLFLTRSGSLTSLLFLCAVILRFYFDTMYDFMPKSAFFIVGGAILLGFGIYFERMRNRKEGVKIEKE